MAMKLNLPFGQTLFLASLPFLLYSLIRCFETIFQEKSPLIKLSKTVLLGVYLNYFLFMVAMMILNGLIETVKRPKEAEIVHKGSGIISQVMRRCLCFTLIYACFKLIGFSLGPLLQQKSFEDLPLTTINGLKEFPRILEEKERYDAFMMTDSPFLPLKNELFEVGKIMGSRPIERSAMTISKDSRTVFLVGKERGVLRILDISDNQNLKMLSTLDLSVQTGPEVSLLLSSNEKILYVSNGLLFNIIDISNLRSPLMLASLIDFDLVEGHVNKDFSLIHTSMALSWNEKFLYVAGCTLQIFVVDNPKNPRLISSTGLKKNLFAISVTTSADRKTLYFANGTVGAYDISLHPNKPALLKTFEGASLINSIILGKDNKTLYAAGRVGENIFLEKIALEENAPFLKSVETFDLGIKSTTAPWILEKSSEENTFFFFTTQDVTINISNKTSKNPVFRVYNLAIREILNHPKNLFLTGPGTLRMIPNTKSFVVSKENQLNIVTFFSNYPNPYSFGLSNSTLGMYKPPERIIVTAVPSTLGIDRLYAITIFRSIHYFSIIDMFNKDDPEILVSFPLDIQAGFIKVAESANRAFAIDQDDNKIQVLNFSDISKVESLGLVQLESFDQKNFHPSNDGKTVFMEIPSETIAENQLRMLDFSDLSSVKVTAAENIDTSIQDSTAQVSSSQGIIFLCLNKDVSIYNLSAPSSSRKVASFVAPSKGEQTAVSIVQCHLFEEKGIFFLETNNWDATHYLSVFNISELTSPQLLTTIPLPQFRNREEFITARISSDAAKVYFWDLEHISVIDLSDIKSPVIVGQIPLSWSSEYSGVLPKFYLSGDNKFAYCESLEKIYMVNLQMKYTLFLRNNNFALGKKYAAVDFMLLRMMNGKFNFETFAQSNYKIIKLSLFKISLGEERYEAQTRFIPLADWISYDKENSLLNIESKKEGDLGNHTLYSACSLKIPFDAFEFIGNRSATEDLVASLVSVGFLDNQRFLTSSFGDFDSFLIQSQYSDQKTQIYKTLKEYYFETFTPLELVPSLALRGFEGSDLSIQTPSLDVIKVDIKLKSLDNEIPQFLLRNYGAIVPLISEYKTRLRIEGSLSEVNFALAKLVINNKTLDCDGEIIVTDNLNQPLVKDVKNIAKYFTNNKPPRVNLDVQNQINIVPIYTGEFTSINLNQKTFVDDNVEDLSYKLVMNTPERHEKPSWIAFSNNDLTMKITAPEQLFDREIKLLLIAENEFEKLEVPFVLKIRLSSAYILKLLIQSSPYLLTIIGLYIKANKIYNIVFVKRYKHKKEYFVEIEKEIEIPPIWFIAEEKKESELIFKKMMRDLGSDRDKLVDHFWNSELDVEKLRQTIEETVAGIGEKKKLKFYLSEGKSRKNLIHQMIENQMIMCKLDSKREKTTKEIYNKMNSSWSELVDWNHSKDQFVICQERFDEILTSFGAEEVSDSKDSTGDSIYLSESLLKKNDKQINTDLLKKSLLILAFENHSLNLKGVKAYVKVKQREVGNCFMKVLREDLIDVSFSHKGTAGYGIMYNLDEDRLEFSGVPKKHLEDETLIIQITNIHERIVKELWIHGVRRRNEVMDKSYGVL